MRVYIYQAALLCEDDGKRLIKQFGRRRKKTDDSDTYPDGPIPDGGGEADVPQHCDLADKCINRVETERGHWIGAFLGNPLTAEGVEYVCDAIRNAKGEHQLVVTRTWHRYYEDLYPEIEKCVAPHEFTFKVGDRVELIDEDSISDSFVPSAHHPHPRGTIRSLYKDEPGELYDVKWDNEDELEYEDSDYEVDQLRKLVTYHEEAESRGQRRMFDGTRGGEVDDDAAYELELYIVNDGDLYRQQTEPILKNLRKKYAKGVYDAALAVKAWGYLVESGAKKYAKEHGTPGTPWHEMFNVATRKRTAENLEAYYHEEVVGSSSGTHGLGEGKKFRIYLNRVRLNSGGYDSNGRYWGAEYPQHGVGPGPLYEYHTDPDDAEIYGHVRARDHADAKAKVTEIFLNKGYKREEFVLQGVEGVEELGVTTKGGSTIPEKGYAYVYRGKEDWAEVSDEEWDTEVVSPAPGSFVHVGVRSIDDVFHDVWAVEYGYIAQKAMGR